MTEISRYLDRAAELGDKGDLYGAIDMIDQAIARTKPGDLDRQQCLQRRIYLLVSAGRLSEALQSANQIIGDAPEQAQGDQDLAEVLLSGGYHQRAKVQAAIGEPTEAFLDSVRAEWHWHHAMALQDRLDESPPADVANAIREAARSNRIRLEEPQVTELVLRAMDDPDPEPLLSSFRSALGSSD